MHIRARSATDGQIVVLFAAAAVVLLLIGALAVDGGYAFSQKRVAQNSADLAALAAAKIINTGGSDSAVRTAIQTTVQSNGGTVTFGSPTGPRYVGKDGSRLGFVGSGMPIGAVGAEVPSSRTWRPFIAGIAGFDSWSASAIATARGVNNAQASAGIFPVGISVASFDRSIPGHISLCPIGTPAETCGPSRFTDGSNNVPGGKSWLKFGCAGYGLGQGSKGGCDNDKNFLQEEIGPPGNSFGCCTAVGLPGSPDKIGSLPGNKASADCDYYIENDIIVTVPVWDQADDGGSGGWYHIVGFAGFQLTDCNGGKDVEGVWRYGISPTPSGSTQLPAGVPPVTIQLIR